MKSLHIFPLFGPELINGSEHYEYMLSKSLLNHGIQVDVLATRANRIQLTSAFCTNWSNAYPEAAETADGLNIQRFSVEFQIPARLGALMSAFVLRRWGFEERQHGTMASGSLHLASYYMRRSGRRPWLYDALARLGLGPWSISLLRYLNRNIRHYDIVLAGFMPFSLLPQVVWLARHHNVPVALLPLFHPDDLYHYSSILGRSLSQADGLLTLTPYSTELVGKLWPASSPYHVGAGVDLDDFMAPTVSGERFRARYGLSDKRIVLYVGRKEPGKRYDLAIEAIESLQRDDTVLVLVGADTDRRPIHGPNIRYLGVLARSNLIDAYDACDILIMPSEHESFGMVILEAWARGKPVLGNRNCRPIASLIRPGIDGYLCDQREEFATRIGELIDNPSLAQSMGANGLERVLEYYNWHAVGERVLAAYQSILTRRANAQKD